MDMHVPKTGNQELVFSVNDGSVVRSDNVGSRANLKDVVSLDDDRLIRSWRVLTRINYRDLLYCREVLSSSGHTKPTEIKSCSAEIHVLNLC
jgi:hypothetical protein